MGKPEPKAITRILLKRYGRTFAEELGIDAEANTPPELFRMLVSAMRAI